MTLLAMSRDRKRAILEDIVDNDAVAAHLLEERLETWVVSDHRKCGPSLNTEVCQKCYQNFCQVLGGDADDGEAAQRFINNCDLRKND